MKITIVIRGSEKGSTKTISRERFNEMVSKNIHASFQLENKKRSERHKAKIERASQLINGLI